MLPQDCSLPDLSRFLFVLPGDDKACGQRCSYDDVYLGEPCAKHLSPCVFPVRDITLRFISLNLGALWSDLSDSCISTTTTSVSFVF